MKKLAVLMMIPALAMFMVPAMGSADDQDREGRQTRHTRSICRNRLHHLQCDWLRYF